MNYKLVNYFNFKTRFFILALGIVCFSFNYKSTALISIKDKNFNS